MGSHLHLLCEATEGLILSDVIRDFKKFTSKKIVQTIIEEPESRREWMLAYFQKACEHLKREQNYKVCFASSPFRLGWQNGYYAEIVETNWFIKQKINYIHNNPVAEGYVFRPEDYKYISDIDYSGQKGLLNSVVIFQYFKF